VRFGDNCGDSNDTDGNGGDDVDGDEHFGRTKLK
jgi:hypothetical protein